MNFEWEFLLFFIIFVTFLAFLMPFLPASWQFISFWDLGLFGGGIIGVASACVLVTGIPCAIALVIFGVLNILNSFYIANLSLLWVKTLIFLPLTLIVTYIIAKLGRGH